MLTSSSVVALQKIADSGHVPAVSYAHVEFKTDIHEWVRTALAVGKKNAQDMEADLNTVNVNSRFPASSLSKIVFAYLVLQLVKDKQMDLDTPLHDLLHYERFLIDGEYPQKARELTARHVLSHTTGLPNLGPSLSSTLRFDPGSELGEGYSYSGESFLYLQKVIEAKMGKDLETLAQEYVFGPLGMERSTFLPSTVDDTDLVSVHTELGKPTAIYVGDPQLNAAGSLLTTSEDFSKFIAAWFEQMDDPILKQAFVPRSTDDLMTCGLGWHIYRDGDAIIAYQFGTNPNTRAFVAINLTEKKGTAFFTNSENGMCIANQVLNSPELGPIGNIHELFKFMHYNQSDEPGWQETMTGKIAEDQDKFEIARHYFERALELAPENESKKRRLEWFNQVHQPAPERELTLPLDAFVGNYKNPYNDDVLIAIQDGSLIFKEFGQAIKLVPISETEFLPEKDQSFKIRFDGAHMIISFVHGGRDKFLEIAQPEITFMSFMDRDITKLTTDQQRAFDILLVEACAIKDPLDSKDPAIDNNLRKTHLQFLFLKKLGVPLEELTRFPHSGPGFFKENSYKNLADFLNRINIEIIREKYAEHRSKIHDEYSKVITNMVAQCEQAIVREQGSGAAFEL